MGAAGEWSVGEEAIPYGADRDRCVGETINVNAGHAAATVPTLEFFEPEPLNIVGGARLA